METENFVRGSFILGGGNSTRSSFDNSNLFRCLKEHSVNFEHQFENHNYHDMCVHEAWSQKKVVNQKWLQLNIIWKFSYIVGDEPLVRGVSCNGFLFCGTMSKFSASRGSPPHPSSRENPAYELTRPQFYRKILTHPSLCEFWKILAPFPH